MDLGILITTQGKCTMFIKQRTSKNIFNQTEPLIERHATQIIPAVSCGQRRHESGNDDRKGESSETSSTRDDDDRDSYNRHVKEFQKRAISRFPVRCRTMCDAH